jgi:ankyrin repeat protein
MNINLQDNNGNTALHHWCNIGKYVYSLYPYFIM